MLVSKTKPRNLTEKNNASSEDRAVFFISDRTGITAEVLGNSLLTQFESLSFKKITIPFIDTPEKAEGTLQSINQENDKNNLRPIVFATIINDEIREIIAESKGYTIDFFKTFIGPLELILENRSSGIVGLSHSIKDTEEYHTKMDALNFALAYDDGVNIENYQHADLILVGVSRSGKTPTSIYKSLLHNYSIQYKRKEVRYRTTTTKSVKKKSTTYNTHRMIQPRNPTNQPNLYHRIG